MPDENKGVEMDQAGAIGPDVTPEIATEETASATSGAGAGDFDFRRESLAALQEGDQGMEEAIESIQIRELKEWTEGELQENIQQVLGAQETICTDEADAAEAAGDTAAAETCRANIAEAKGLFTGMFGEALAAEEEEEPAA